MKIIFILPSAGRSGGLKATVMAANHLLDRGHEVRILHRKTKKTIRGMLKFILFPLIYLGHHSMLKEFNGTAVSFKKISDCQFDKNEIIIGSGMWASSQVATLEDTNNRKLQYIHGEHIVNPKDTEKALKSPLPKVVVSSFLKPLVDSYGGDVLAVIPNGIDKREYFQSVNDSAKDGVGAIYSSHVAKDPETLLAILEKLSYCRPRIPLRVFSQDKRPEGIPRDCFWRLPSIQKAREIYSRSLVWIVASRSEGFSLPVLEAMACRCAVVATDCGGPRDIIRDGKNGYIVEVGDVDGILERVSLLLADRELRKRICSEALKTVNEFSWENSVDKLEHVLSNL